MAIKNEYEYKPMNKYDVTVNAVKSLLSNYDKLKEQAPKKSIFLGFDGYVDSLYSTVRSRIDAQNFQIMESMKEFGNRIIETSGSSCNIERVLKKELAGGFAPNMARAISHLGSTVFLAAAMGYPHMHPLFLEYPDTVKHYSIKNNGTTAAYEYNDGKVMTTDFGNINSITWDTIMERIPRDTFIDLIEKSDAVGQGHWSLMPNMNSYWEHMIDEIFPNISNPKKKIFMVDIADLEKRTHKDLNKMLQILQKVDEVMPAMLSMNDKETLGMSEVLSAGDSSFSKNRITPITSREDYIDIGQRMNEVLNLSYIVTHDPHFATITTKNKHSWITEGHTSKPRFTTAAGDHFNGALLLSLVCGLEPEAAIAAGNSLTAVFVRTGVSVNFDTMKRFVDDYISYVVNDITEYEITQ